MVFTEEEMVGSERGQGQVPYLLAWTYIVSCGEWQLPFIELADVQDELDQAQEDIRI